MFISNFANDTVIITIESINTPTNPLSKGAIIALSILEVLSH